MAFTLNKIVGFDTEGSEEAFSTSGTPGYSTAVARTVANGGLGACLSMGTGDVIGYAPFDEVSDAGDSQCIGFALYDLAGASAGSDILEASDSVGSCWTLEFGPGGNTLRLLDANGSTIASGTATLSTSTWYFIEIVWDHAASGSIDLFINGATTADITASAQDLTGGGTFNLYEFKYSASAFFVDDCYMASGLTATTDKLGDAEVLTYQTDQTGTGVDAGLTSAGTSGGDTLGAGTWPNAAETPGSDSNTATYSGSNTAGAVDLDAHSSDTDGDSNIRGLKGIWRLGRSNGSGTTFYIGLGDSDDTNVPDQTVSLATSAQNFIWTKTTGLPTDAQAITQGFGKSSGGRDIVNYEMWASLLHVPDAATLVSFDTLSYTHTLPDAGVTVNTPVSFDALSYAQTLNDVTLSFSVGISFDALSYALVLNDATIIKGTSVDFDVLGYSLTLPDVAMVRGYDVSFDVLGYTHTLPDLGVLRGFLASLDALSYAHTLDDLTARKGYETNLDALSYVHTLPDFTLLTGLTVGFDTINYSYAIPDLTLLAGRAVDLDALAYSHALNDVSVVINTTIAFDALAYLHTLNDLGVDRDVPVTFDALSYAQTLETFGVTLGGDTPVLLDQFTYAHSLNDITVLKGSAVNFDTIAYSHTLPAVAVSTGYVSDFDVLAYTQTLSDIDIVVSEVVSLDALAYSHTLPDIGVVVTGGEVEEPFIRGIGGWVRRFEEEEDERIKLGREEQRKLRRIVVEAFDQVTRGGEETAAVAVQDAVSADEPSLGPGPVPEAPSDGRGQALNNIMQQLRIEGIKLELELLELLIEEYLRAQDEEDIELLLLLAA